MKKQVISLIAASLIIGVAIVSVISYSKTEQEKVNQEGTITHFSPSQEMVEPTIKTFIQRFEDYKAGYKTNGEDIKLGEAIWTLEAGVNYEYQSPKEELGDFTSEETTFNMNVYVGEDNEYYITEEDAIGLYSDMMEFTGNQVNSENVDLYVADLEVISVENGQVEMKFEALAGGINPDPFVDCEVNSTDYWKAANGAGKCSIYEYQYIGKDAASRISILLNCIKLNVGYWTDVENTGHISQLYDNGSNPCFWGMESPGYYYECLDPTDIAYWWGQAEYVIDYYEPTGKDYIDCRFTDDLWVGSGQVWFHRFENIRYGVPQSGGGS